MFHVDPVFMRTLDDAAMPIVHGVDARMDAIVADATSALATSRRLGTSSLGSEERPLAVLFTEDPLAAATPSFVDRDVLMVGTAPIDERAREFLARSGQQVDDRATWLDLDLGPVIAHEVAGHGTLNELVPQVMRPVPRVGAWRTAAFDRKVVEEAASDVAAALHHQDWIMRINGAVVRDARAGTDLVAEGLATIDMLNDARYVARGGVDDARMVDDRHLAGSSPHALAGTLSSGFAIVQRDRGWQATERVFTDTLHRLAAREYPIDVPSTARETVRATAEAFGRTSDVARDVKRHFMRNGALG